MIVQNLRFDKMGGRVSNAGGREACHPDVAASAHQRIIHVNGYSIGGKFVRQTNSSKSKNAIIPKCFGATVKLFGQHLEM
jgi:hypothetical protein